MDRLYSRWFKLTKQYKCAVVSSYVAFSPNCNASSTLLLHKTQACSDIFFVHYTPSIYRTIQRIILFNHNLYHVNCSQLKFIIYEFQSTQRVLDAFNLPKKNATVAKKRGLWLLWLFDCLLCGFRIYFDLNEWVRFMHFVQRQTFEL